jgi:hypothetical protein
VLRNVAAPTTKSGAEFAISQRSTTSNTARQVYVQQFSH